MKAVQRRVCTQHPRRGDVNRVTSADTRGCSCCCTGTSIKGGCAEEYSGGATVADSAGRIVTGNDLGCATNIDDGPCCCGPNDAPSRGVGEDSGVHQSIAWAAGTIPRSPAAIAIAGLSH